MISEYQYVNVRRVLDEVLRHPLLQDITLEQAVSYVVSFLGIFGMPKLFMDKEEKIHIEDFRALLPCDLISINQVKDCKTGICLRSTTDTFTPMSHKDTSRLGLTFKTQGQVIYVSFEKGDILVSYKAIPVDKDGFPLLIDNPVFLRTLEAYIKKEAFTILFDTGKIALNVYENALSQYAWLAGQLHSEFTIPSVSEMESIKNMWCTLLQRTTEFGNGFRDLGRMERVRVH